MSHALTLIVSLLVVLTSSQATETFFMTAAPATSPIPWKTALTLTCLWNADDAGLEAEFAINSVSIYSSDSPYNVEGDDEKATLEVDMGAGEAVLTINDLTAADNAMIQCSVSRLGLTKDPYYLVVLEPPSAAVADITVSEVSFTSAVVSFSEVENASEYTIGIEFDGQAVWEEFTTSELTYTLENLNVATAYSVRVKAGNAAGYRDNVELESQTFTTLDNRPCVAVDGIAVDPDTAYNASTITVTWSLDSNTVPGFVIDEILVKAMQGGVVVADSEMTLAGDATDATFILPATGVYDIIVSTHNAYSADVDTSVAINHEVKETTAPPPPPPTEPAPEPEPTEDNSVDETEPEETDLQCSDPNGASSYSVGQLIVRELIPGKNVQIECFLSESSSSSNGDIVWSYEGGAVMNQAQLTSNDTTMSLDIETDVKKSIFKFAPVQDNYAGTYKCALGSETCTFQVTLTELAISASATHCLSALLALLSVVVLHLLY